MIDAGTGTVSDPTSLDGLFRNNATRITTTANNYLLSLMYNNDYVVTRVRRVQYDAAGIRNEGKWIYKCQKDGSSSSTYNYTALQWNEPALNWQYAASFAEEGKKKEVVNYFDGSLRDRQMVTLNNSDKIAVAQEDIYDDFGRKTASILPATYQESAGLTPFLHYIPNFNLASAGTPYASANIFGTTPNCNPLPQALSTLSGAANYYSSANPAKGTGFNKFLPDAGGYPISVTQYTADNTGRIKTQGGVGPQFQPGLSSPKTTRYFYGKPEQWELDQLFGNDVGYAEHYQKNMVLDPNGQISVSYLNASGKTIATALAGTAPANLDALGSDDPKTSGIITTRILKPEMFTFSGDALKISATTTYVESAVENNIKLQYSIPQILYYHPDAPALCSNCYYKLNIRIVDDCGTTVTLPGFVPSTEIGSKLSNPSLTAPVTGTISGVTFDHPGTYFITLELAYDKDVVQAYADNYVSYALTNNLLKNQYDYVKQNFLKDLSVSNCYADCKTCAVLLGTQADFKAMLKTKFHQYQVDSTSTSFQTWGDSLYTALKSQCTLIQGSCDFSPCESYAAMLRPDVSPGGQYALFDANYAPLETPINVFDDYNFHYIFGPAHLPTRPLNPDEYIDLGDGKLMSVYDANFTLALMVQHWNPAWADRFLQFHPEYCKLQFCQQNNALLSWDEKIKQTILKAADVVNIPGLSPV